jgi:integrase
MVKNLVSQEEKSMARMARNIYHRKDGRFEGRYIKCYGEDGKARYASVFAATYAEAKEKLERAIVSAPVARCVKPAAKNPSVHQAMESYLESLKCQIKPSTYGIYQRYIENYITPYFGNTRCDALSLETAQAFVNHQVENGLSAVTVQSVFSFFKAGVKPTRGEDAFAVKLPKRTKTKVEFFSVDEQKRLESAAKTSGDADYMSIILCLYTGIRIGEVCGLMWKDIDFECRLVHIRRTMQRIQDDGGGDKKTKIAFLAPKSLTSARSIPLPEFLLEFLKERKDTAEGNYVISRNGEPVEPRTLQYRFKNLLDTAGVKEVNFHATRHTFATRALENGFDVKSLSEILGHASPTMTLNKYAHALDEHKRNRMNALATVWN